MINLKSPPMVVMPNFGQSLGLARNLNNALKQTDKDVRAMEPHEIVAAMGQAGLALIAIPQSQS